jgi:hypothetical protein
MARILVATEIFDIQGAAFASIERAETLVYFATKGIELFDVRKQPATDLFLIGVGQPRNLRNGLIERLDHGDNLSTFGLAGSENWSGDHPKRRCMRVRQAR